MAKPKKKYSNLSKVEIKFIKEKLGIKKIEEIDVAILKKLRERLKELKDSRNQNMIIYKLWDVIICVIVASIAQNDTWEEIHDYVIDHYGWFKSFLQMTGGIPTADSYERIIGLVDSDELNNILIDFFTSITLQKEPKYRLRNFDGRVNNGSKRDATILNKNVTPLNCLNVYDNYLEYCIVTKAISEKSNEIPAVKEIIEGMNLNGITVTWDALNTQKDNVSAVINAGGNYTVPIKGNHPDFLQNLCEYFDEERCDEIKAGNTQSQYLTYTEKSHSAIIQYESFQTSDIGWYDRCNEWEGLQTIGLVRKTITKKVMVKNERKNAKNQNSKIEKTITTTENRYYISSKFVNIDEFDYVTRGHWGMENKVHFHLDFTFCQDSNSTINKNALMNLEIIHKFVLAILNKVKARYKSKSLKSIRKHISNNTAEFFPELLCYLMLY